MPVPKRKRSRARRDSRFANKGIKPKALTRCPNCDVAIVPHQVCAKCGHYKGVKVMVTKMERTLKRGDARKAQQERIAKIQEQQKAATAASEKASE